MSYVVAPFIPGNLLTTTPTVYYTSPTGTNSRIQQMTLTNIDGAPHVVHIWLPQSSSAPANQDLLVILTLAASGQAGSSVSVYQAVNQSLNAGATIQASCDTLNVVNLKCSGVQSS